MKRLNRSILSTCFVTKMNICNPPIQSMIKWGHLNCSEQHTRRFGNWMNNFLSKKNSDDDGGKGRSRKDKRNSAMIIMALGGILVLYASSNYYIHSSQLGNVKIIEEGSLRGGEMCKIYGQLNSNMVLKLDNQQLYDNNQEPVFIYETSKEGKSFFFKGIREDRLKCYTNDLEVKFGFGKSFSDWFDSSKDLTETLKIDLNKCKIFKEPTEYSAPVDKYNAHMEYICTKNRNIEFTRKVHELVELFNIQIVQRVMNKNDKVILIGKVDPESGVFKCETLISPNNQAMYSKLNRDLVESVGWAAFLGMIATIVSL